MMAAQQAQRLCRTVDDVRAAALADAQNDRPLTTAEIDRIAAMWRPYHRPVDVAATA